jgi:dynein light intermediate chain
MRKQLQAEHGKADLEKRITELEAKKTKQTNKVIELKAKLEAIEARNQERKEQEDKKRQAELDFLKYQEKHLSQFLKQVTESSNK